MDELQEDLELRDLKIIEYERGLELPSEERIRIESVEDKIKFITGMLEKLREMHNSQKQEEMRQRKIDKRRGVVAAGTGNNRNHAAANGKLEDKNDDRSPK